MKPYEVNKFPNYFKFEDKKYKEDKNGYTLKVNGKESATDKKDNNQLMEAWGAGTIITKEEYDKE